MVRSLGCFPPLLAAAVLLLALTRRAPRTDRLRAAAVLWGGTLAVSAAVISFTQGIIHPYYTVALAPPIGALVGIGGVTLFSRRRTWWARLTLAVAVLGTGIWSAVLLDRTPGWHPWIRTAVVVVAAVPAVVLAFGPRLRRLGMLVAGLGGIVAALLGPAAIGW